MKVNCPTCKAEVIWSEESKYRPFCSDRCRLIDLGEWASESRSIAGSSDDLMTEDLEFQIKLKEMENHN
ncbi:DNA gyrase inhibitor YacG [Bibersteinia trehalosi USDA-ARS-USMARC-188]|uniref:DNA gyrase inhibitor YacG n=5 Tax=Bibersteinia trehalosi TaxID=47735 RepID=W0RA09_BIBTR|nr:DNA gyrase inhibitor YacG [Bibersteinia trehalosi]AGH38208.1 DNA gyrase inhibitor YacG [Bibersteinia trehalosi USDA-ARS-USMARC-192]AHG81991.1 DNA gyrase inhibitor YacG [Bibersteinia trehalosi USDA-ARS-USMARC-188]AHG84295.1 DNA gyrase inhibitor YacG [Bibersteinia trehalosi USDA-ARS-USMARC-189]AHG86198.1 DNA gyrase inhibitor YacG [Bibersteinia trehalosi USDA-ARS-USMARC-190]OAQ15272.1 dephospho-CoA kinase [Bibersteinia trehalosi Y31]